MRGTSAASAASALTHSRLSPTASAVFGMKWSVRHAASQPVASAWRVRLSTPSHVVFPRPMNSANFISSLHGDAPCHPELRGVRARDQHVARGERAIRRRIEHVTMGDGLAHREDDDAAPLLELEAVNRLAGAARATGKAP